jgi:Flp pilus assembly pilin Flp
MLHTLCKFEQGLHASIPETTSALRQLWSEESGQDVAEYSVMLAVILVIVVGTIRLIGSNAGNIFSQVGSTIQ